MENSADWQTESRAVYSNDFKFRIVKLASQPEANVAKIVEKTVLLTTFSGDTSALGGSLPLKVR